MYMHTDMSIYEFMCQLEKYFGTLVWGQNYLDISLGNENVHTSH